MAANIRAELRKLDAEPTTVSIIRRALEALPDD